MTTFTITANEIKNANTMRVVIETTDYKYCLSYNVTPYTYTAIVRTLLRCVDIAAANSLLISKGAKRVDCL